MLNASEFTSNSPQPEMENIGGSSISRRAMLCGAAALIFGFVPDSAVAATGISQTKDQKIRVDLKVNKVLAKVGGVVSIPLSDGSTLALVRTAVGVKGFTAINLSCTHNGVTVMEQGKAWVCPAHGSQFALNGKLINGPARTGLMKYPVSATSSAVIIG
ncbi:MAG: Rieske (2Fe-2S) protein [Actinomycetes bacterium]